MQWSWWNVCNDHDVWIIFDRKKLRANHKTWKANIKISLKRTFFLRRNMCTTKVAWPTTKSMSVVESRPWDYQIVASINSHFSLRFSQVQKKMHANDEHRNICTSTEYKRSFWLRQSLLQCRMPSTLNRKLCIVADHWTRSNQAGKKKQRTKQLTDFCDIFWWIYHWTEHCLCHPHRQHLSRSLQCKQHTILLSWFDNGISQY